MMQNNDYNNNFNPKSFVFRNTILALVIKEIIFDTILQKLDKIWYLDSRTFQYFCKNKIMFKELQLISIKFKIFRKKIIYF